MRSLMIPSILLVLSGAAIAVPEASAQAVERAYAPEDLRVLSRQDQARVIRKEYAEQSRGRTLPDDQLEFYLDQVNRSSWKFSDVKRDIARSLAGSRPPVAPAPTSVTCGSDRLRYQECATGFPGTAKLAQNLSRTRCIEGQNWGSRPGMVWVDKGCRGRFVPAAVPAYTVTCESDRHTRTCEWDARRGRPVVVDQLSSTPCVEGRTWRYEEGRVWVMQGCGARFGVSGHAPPAAYGVECSSTGPTTTWCAWDARRGVPVVAQDHSGRRCVEGRTWGHVPARGIWVADGCSARFTATR